MQRYTSSVRGIPLLIFSTFAVGCQLSPSTNSHPSWATTACREQGMQQKLTKRKVIITISTSLQQSLPVSASLQQSLQWYTPRCLYGIGGPVLLLCQIFHCPQHHFITTCDPRVLAAFRQRVCIPFVLLHRSGVTREVYHLISDLACQGFSFSDIERIILGKIPRKARCSNGNLWEMNGKSLQQSSGIEFPSLPTQFMSNGIMECFIMMFKTVIQYLWNCMALLVGENLSCDHTFKFPKHIGIMREGKWVPQYDSMFIIQNDRGEVLFWQPTSQTAYSAINDGLNSLKLRSRSQVKTIVISFFLHVVHGGRSW